MKTKLTFILSLLILLVSAYFFIIADFDKTESTLYKNGNIITLENDMPFAEAFFVKNGIIKAIGSSKDLKSFESEKIKIVDLKGATVLPGFIDSHTHVALSAFLENMVDLSGFTHKNSDEVWQALADAVKTKKSGEWIVCKGIDPVLIPDLVTPHISYLDSIAPNNPLVMLSQSLHTYWANSLAFELAGITKETPNPSKSSYYEKDSLGNLTGLIAEQHAFTPILEALKENALSTKVLMQSTAKVLRKYAQNGNTTIVSAGLSINDAKPLRLYEHLSAEKPTFLNQLLSFIKMLPERTANPRHFIYIRYDKAFLMPKEKDTTNNFYNIIGIKHWYDGSPYTGSMFLKEPYLISEMTQKGLHIADGSKGKALIAQDDLVDFIKEYQTKGWQIAIHSQGGIASENILKAFETASKEIDVTKTRNRIEHCLLLSKESMDKILTYNMVPNFHINHLYYYGHALEKHILGAERAQKILPVAYAQSLDLKYALHADQPMFESNPFRLIQTAVERLTKEGDSIGFKQNISVLNGLKSMTINAAWQIHMEDKIGSLKKGKYADFIIVDKNPLKIPTTDLESIKILKTFVNGNFVN